MIRDNVPRGGREGPEGLEEAILERLEREGLVEAAGGGRRAHRAGRRLALAAALLLAGGTAGYVIRGDRVAIVEKLVVGGSTGCFVALAKQRLDFRDQGVKVWGLGLCLVSHDYRPLTRWTRPVRT